MSDTSTTGLHALLLDGRGGARHLSAEELSAWSPEQGVLWVHLDYSEPDDRQWLETGSGLDALIVEALLAEETRPRATSVDGGLLIALRGVNLTPGAEPDDMVALRLWVDRQRIVSTRRRRLLSVGDVVETLDAGKGPHDAAQCLVELIDRLVWRMNDIVDQFEDRVAELEDRIVEEGSAAMRYDLATLRRQAITLRRYLAPQREALSRLITAMTGWLDDSGLLRLREVSDRLVRHIEDLDAVRERAAVVQEELLSRMSEQMNSRMYVLSVVAAIFLPLGFLTGLLGINVGGIPGAEDPFAFLIFIGMLVVVVALQLLVFRSRKWL
jgi:zinc transporter